jgi:CRISPR system Cascade subunit CasD
VSAVVLLRLEGPMQAWGTRSRFTYRDTETFPSKSGVLGLVAAALGRARDADLADLAALQMAVRIDAQGVIETDYQTALGVAKADGSGPDTVLSYRQYLADASFLVALEGDLSLLQHVHDAIRRPRWPLFLGRKGYVPGRPLSVRGGFRTGENESSLGLSEAALRSVEWPGLADGREVPASLDAIVECAPGEDGDVLLDVPLSFRTHERLYAERRIRRVRWTPLEVSP